MKISVTEFTKKARLVKKNDNAEVYDLVIGNLVLSMTVLYQDKSTTGHSHTETEEIYLLVEGKGEICLGNERQEVVSGDIVTVPRGIFHRVFNTGWGSLTFLCFFEKYPGRGWEKCPRCHGLKAYWMSDSHNLWCTNCRAIVE